MSVSFCVRGRRVALSNGLTEAAILVDEGRILDIVTPTQIPAGVATIDAADAVVMPGVVDTHVHINDPGRSEWEGFDTATRAAAAGGVTTVVDMPLNSVPATTDVEAVRAKQTAAAGRLWVDCALWGGVVPGNAGQLEGLVDAGVVGFKAFLVPSGVAEFSHVGERDMREAMPRVARLGVPLLVHAELASPVSPSLADPTDYATYLASRPDRWETDAVRLMIDLCRATRCHVHIVHVSSSEVLPLLVDARRDGFSFTAETCPHYLALAAEEVPQGATAFKCAPPIRSRQNRDELWNALQDGVLDLIASDHSPSVPALKCRDTGNFFDAWGGIASLQLAMPVVWTEARARGIAITDMVRWMSTEPARLCGLDQRKGQLAKGFDADLVIWDPDETFQVEPSSLFHRHSLTPYLGRTLHGVVKTTILRGQVVYKDGSFAGTPIGELICK